MSWLFFVYLTFPAIAVISLNGAILWGGKKDSTRNSMIESNLYWSFRLESSFPRKIIKIRQQKQTAHLHIVDIFNNEDTIWYGQAIFEKNDCLFILFLVKSLPITWNLQDDRNTRTHRFARMHFLFLFAHYIRSVCLSCCLFCEKCDLWLRILWSHRWPELSWAGGERK